MHKTREEIKVGQEKKARVNRKNDKEHSKGLATRILIPFQRQNNNYFNYLMTALIKFRDTKLY